MEILNPAANSMGISRSEYLRRLLLNKPIQIHYEVVADIELLRELVGQYGKIGSKYFRPLLLAKKGVRNANDSNALDYLLFQHDEGTGKKIKWGEVF